MNMQKNICGLLPEELEILCVKQFGQPRFRAEQILKEIYNKHVFDINEMTLIPKELRLLLVAEYDVSIPEIKKRLTAADGTVKFLFQFPDGTCIESVLIREGTRKTVCFSSQAGCVLGCSFCATGNGGFIRNLTEAEIISQILAIEKDTGVKITNCVAMGQGEPLLNYEAVKKAVQLFTHQRTFGMSNRHITVSTVGIVPGIRRMADESLPCKLAVSLHTARQELRNKLIPMNKKYPLQELKEVLSYYVEKTKNRITFEYILLSEINDTSLDADALKDFLKGLPSFVNLIPYNEVHSIPFRRPSNNRIDFFRSQLERAGIEVFVRQEKGKDIMAACGQLTQ